jgi:LuxR family transcriptional regulator, maltose regulon positive regulatory protein
MTTFETDEAKLRIPPLRDGLVWRTALVNRLRGNTSLPLVTVTAPAGYGKTTLLAQWATRESRPLAWVTIDARDSDPVSLLGHVAAAVHAVAPLGPEVFEALHNPGRSIWDSVVPRLGSALGKLDEPLVIVLDDAHLLRSPESLEAVGTLAELVPEGGALVLAGRRAPRLPIAAVRAAGRLFELGADQLALTPREAQALLRSRDVELAFAEVKSLARDCEGWPAAVELAAIALRDHERVQLDRRDGRLYAYLRSEYLSHLSPGALQFLSRTSILEQMCGGLCDAVLDDHGSSRELEKIECSNLFLVPLEGQRVWYRYHRLFRDVLRRELAAREPKLIPLLHRRAARWYEAHGDIEAAFEHACAAGDVNRVARIFSTAALPLYNGGRSATVENWLARLDNPILLERHPAVALRGSWIHALRGRAADARRWLECADVGIATRSPSAQTRAMQSWTAVIRAALCTDGVYQMIADAETALANVQRDSQIRPRALVTLGAAYFMLGQKRRADAIFAEAAAEADRLGATAVQVLAMGERSIIAAELDDAPAAEQLAYESRALADRSRLEGYATTAIAVAASARASLRHGRWDEARLDLSTAERLAAHAQGDSMPWFLLQTRIELARAHLSLRETEAARSLLAEIRALLDTHPYMGVLGDEADVLEREIEAVPDYDGAHAALTPAELRLLPYLATQLSFREIGEHLYVSRNTIKTQAISVYRKLGVASRSGAIDCASRLGLIDMRPQSPRSSPRLDDAAGLAGE